MTTICYKRYEDRVEICADTQLSFGNAIWKTPKLVRLEDGSVIGLTGSVAQGAKVLAWWEGGCEGDPPEPEEKESDDWDVGGLLFKADGSVHLLVQGTVATEVLDDFGAAGTGVDYARAFLSMGLTPEQAIAHTSELDVFTNDVVQVEVIHYKKDS